MDKVKIDYHAVANIRAGLERLALNNGFTFQYFKTEENERFGGGIIEIELVPLKNFNVLSVPEGNDVEENETEGDQNS